MWLHRPALSRALILATTLFALLLAVGAAGAQADALPAQGLYDTCEPASSPDGCAGRVQRIGQAGFRVVTNGSVFGPASAAQLLAYADAARAAGVQVIWPLHALASEGTDPTGKNMLAKAPALAATCGCSDNQGMLAYVISLVRGLPNTWGYYMADEPTSDKHDRLRGFVDQVKALDPDHPRLLMVCGVCGHDPAGWSDLDIAVGSDAYPVLDKPPNAQAAYDWVTQNGKRLQDGAPGPDRQRVMALQAWRYGDSHYDSEGLEGAANTRFPTSEEITAQRDAAIDAAKPSLILWFTLWDVVGWDGNQRPWYWDSPSDPDQRWANLVQGAFAPHGAYAGSAPPPSAGIPPPVAPASKPLPRYTVRVAHPPARVGKRVLLKAHASPDTRGTGLRYAWTLDGRRLKGCAARRCAFRARRSGAHRIALVVDDGGRRAAAHKRLRVAKGASGGRRR
jgi:hypothetical protein